jgi:hypothetical protein
MDFVAAAYQSNPNINIEVFVHKSEKLPEDDKVGKSLFWPLALSELNSSS